MGYRETYLMDLGLDEIECKLSEFDSDLQGEYLDWEIDVTRCIGDFPHSSRWLGAVIGKQLVGCIGIWWRVHVMRRRLNGYDEYVSWDYMRRVLRQKLVPIDYQDQQLRKLKRLKQEGLSIKEYAEKFKTLVRQSELDESPKRLISRFIRGLRTAIVKLLDHHHSYLTLEEVIRDASSAQLSLSIGEMVGKYIEQVRRAEKRSNEILTKIPESDHEEQAESIENVIGSVDEENTVNDSESGTVDDGGIHSCNVEEAHVHSCVIDLEPLPCTPRATDSHRYYHILIPSLYMFYTNPLMGLRSGAEFNGCIVPVRAYNIFVGIHWSISDGFMY